MSAYKKLQCKYKKKDIHLMYIKHIKSHEKNKYNINEKVTVISLDYALNDLNAGDMDVKQDLLDSLFTDIKLNQNFLFGHFFDFIRKNK